MFVALCCAQRSGRCCVFELLPWRGRLMELTSGRCRAASCLCGRVWRLGQGEARRTARRRFRAALGALRCGQIERKDAESCRRPSLLNRWKTAQAGRQVRGGEKTRKDIRGQVRAIRRRALVRNPAGPRKCPEHTSAFMSGLAQAGLDLARPSCGVPRLPCRARCSFPPQVRAPTPLCSWSFPCS